MHLRDRFENKVERIPGVDCWLWAGAHNRYGHLAVNGETKLAHRVSWELAHGPITGGMNVLHKCDTPLCVRPDHLFLGTQRENILDAVRKGRQFVMPVQELNQRRAQKRLLAREA